MLTGLLNTFKAGVLAAATVVTLAVAAAPAQAQAANSPERWLPAQTGNRWVLRDAATGDAKEIRVDYASGSLRYVSGLFEGNRWIGTSSASPNTLFVWNEDAGAWHILSRFGYITSPWRFDLSSGGCDLFDARWATGSGAGQAGTTQTVPAGTFSGVREMKLQMTPAPTARCAAPYESVFFAPQVGIVRIVTAAGKRYDLESAVVGTEVYPKPAAASVQAALAVDKRIYINKPNTIRCITTPCPSNEVTDKARFTFTVKNNTRQPITFQFSSGQQFDVELLDARGNVVKAWADGRMFTMALTQRTLRAGETWTITAELELKDRNGAQLDGTFTAKARLTTANWSQPVMDVSATNQVTVRVQP